jgi:carbamoyl-phosphate synthase L subunit-like protein
MSISKILIANRVEIAVQIIRAARDLGLATAHVFSQADRDMLAVKLADEAVTRRSCAMPMWRRPAFARAGSRPWLVANPLAKDRLTLRRRSVDADSILVRR